MVKHDTLLICSSIRENRQELRRNFSDRFHLLEAVDSRQLTQLLSQNLSCIAAVLLDISDRQSLDLEMLLLNENKTLLQKIPVIVLLQQDTPEILSAAFRLGAADVIPIGYDPYAMLCRVENIVDLHLHKQHLESIVAEQKHMIRSSCDTIVDALSSIIEYHSLESSQHVHKIRHYTKILLDEVARCCPEYGLTEESIDVICSASVLHDVG